LYHSIFTISRIRHNITTTTFSRRHPHHRAFFGMKSPTVNPKKKLYPGTKA